MSTIVPIYSKHAGCVCWIVSIVTCESIKRTCGCSCLKCTWSVTQLTGRRGANPPAKLNVKTGPLPSLHFGIYYSFGFSRLLFFCILRSVFRWFRVFVWPFNIGFAIVSQLFSECQPVDPLELSFPMAQTSSYVTAPDQSKVLLQIGVMRRASSSILQ